MLLIQRQDQNTLNPEPRDSLCCLLACCTSFFCLRSTYIVFTARSPQREISVDKFNLANCASSRHMMLSGPYISSYDIHIHAFCAIPLLKSDAFIATSLAFLLNLISQIPSRVYFPSVENFFGSYLCVGVAKSERLN